MDYRPTVFVVDDDAEVRQSLRWLIESIDLPVETYASAEEFLAAYDASRAGCVVVDVRMPGMGGLGLQSQLAERGLHLPVIIISAFADVAMAVRAMKAGAVTLLEKPFQDQALLDQINEAISRDRAAREEAARTEDFDNRVRQLTPREDDVYRLMVMGFSTKQIAAELGISPKTVEAHRGQVMKKMGAESIAELVRIAVTKGSDENVPG
jgi:two-component system response regulator FixJ